MKPILSFALTLLTFAFPIVSAQAQQIFIVDSLTDGVDINPGNGVCLSINGVCSLRAAIQEANALPNGPSPDVIRFTNIPIVNGRAIIEVVNDVLPAIVDPVMINGASAAGEVVLNGEDYIGSSPSRGLDLAAGSDGSTINGLSIGNFDKGILVSSEDNVITNNHLGVLMDGTVYGNRDGISLYGSNNRIGGIDEGNVLGFNSSGIETLPLADGNIIRGNYVGTNENGENFGNSFNGIILWSNSNIIGGPTPEYGNTIGFNGGSGIILSWGNNIVRNNYIGTDQSGRDLGNGGEGINTHSPGNTIGGLKRYGNVIGFNSGGIYLRGDANKVRGNYIGTNDQGENLGNDTFGIQLLGESTFNNKIGYRKDAAIPLNAPIANTIAFNGAQGVSVILGYDYMLADPEQNSIRGNHIYGNGTAGIDLNGDGPTLNDAGDADDGPNTQLNYPDVIRVDYNGGFDVVAVEYALSSDSTIVNYPLMVDVYIADDAVSGQGKTYIGTDIYTTQDQVSIFSVDANSITWASTDVLVLTATDADGNTSEFSPVTGEIGGAGSAFAGQRDVLNLNNDNPESYRLSAAYPNPFNPQTTFTLSLVKPAHTHITVHNALGQQVVELHNGELSAGLTHTFTFDGAGLASGIYLLRVDSGQVIETRRLLLVK